MNDERLNGPEIEELHEFVMDVIGDYIDFEHSFPEDTREMEGNADEGDDLETMTLYDTDGRFEVTIERGYKQRGMNGDEYVYDVNYQGTHIEGDYDAYASWLKRTWPGVYEEALDEWKMVNPDRITPEDKKVDSRLALKGAQ
jgi:hypothetical protein